MKPSPILPDSGPFYVYNNVTGLYFSSSTKLFTAHSNGNDKACLEGVEVILIRYMFANTEWEIVPFSRRYNAAQGCC